MRKVLFLLIIPTFMLLNGCSKPQADLVIHNARIYTVDSLFTQVESFAVREGKIIATGTSEEMLSQFNATQTIDLQGKFVYPGFIDAHAHFYGYGMNLLQQADLTGTSSQEEICAVLKKHYETYGGEWLLGRGWDQNDWPVKAFPGKEILDLHFPDVPVYLTRVDGHAGWCNSKALALAGITGESKVKGGEVLLLNGQPTGVLVDNAESLVTSIIPKPDAVLQTNALLAAQENCTRAGLTSVTDCGVSKEVIILMDTLQKEGRLRIRINAMINPDAETMQHFLENGIYKTERLQVNTVKIYADGALGSRGALMLEPYADDPENKGLQIETQEYYDDICRRALAHNYQVATHCIGDSANRLMLNTYAKFLEGKNDRRWRIEHAQVVHPYDFRLFGDYSIVPSVQATHATSDMFWADERLGNPRIKGAYAYRELKQQLGWIPNGTDFPVEAIDPLYTFYAAVFRTNHAGEPAGGFQSENGLSREEAIRSMTIWAAKASFEEGEKGSIETGKWADFVVLDTDLMQASPEEVLKAKPESTWIAGEAVFGN